MLLPESAKKAATISYPVFVVLVLKARVLHGKKKVYDFSVPNSWPGRVWLVTSRLRTGKSITFLTSRLGTGKWQTFFYSAYTPRSTENVEFKKHKVKVCMLTFWFA
jgi:hypothetical protein